MSEQAPVSAPLAALGGAVPAAPDWFRAALALEPERSMIPVAGADIELLTWGRVGAPGILLLHGNGAHADWWSFIAPMLADTYRIAAISWSGMGGSGWRERYTGELFAQEAFAAAEAAQLSAGGAKPVFIGHSFGGFPTVYCAARHPERLAGAVLIDTTIQPPHRRWKGPPPRGEAMRVYPDLAAALARFRLAPPQGCENLYIADHIARTALKSAPMADGSGAMGWTWRFDPKMWSRFEMEDSGELLSRIATPCAMMWGDRSGLMDEETLTYMLGQMPDHTLRIPIPDADHHVMVDQPLALTAALRALLAVWPPVASGAAS